MALGKLLNFSELWFLALENWWNLFVPGMSETLKRYVCDRVVAHLERLPAHSRCWKSQTPLNSDTARMGALTEASQTWDSGLGSQDRQNLGQEKGRVENRVTGKCKDSHFLDFMKFLS